MLQEIKDGLVLAILMLGFLFTALAGIKGLLLCLGLAAAIYSIVCAFEYVCKKNIKTNVR